MRRKHWQSLAVALFAIQFATIAFAQQPPVDAELSPGGRLRCAVIGIPVLGGIGQPIGKYIAARLGASFEPVVYPNPQAYEQSFAKADWDIALGPRVLAPADKADVTGDLWLIDLQYFAAPGKAFASSDQVDRAGAKLVRS